jgi:hypothetical protein
MKSLRHPLQRSSLHLTAVAVAIFAALIAALSLATTAEAKPPAMFVTDVFAVTYDAKATYQHHLALPEYNETQGVSYQLHGRLPEVTFVDGLLSVDKSAAIDTRVKGKATVEVSVDDGDWLSCGGTDNKVRGIAGIGRAERGIWFLPAHSAAPSGTCVSAEGAHPPFDLTVPWPGEGHDGAVTFPVTTRSIDVPSWSKPFRIVFEDEKCPNYEAESTISCSFVIQGKLNLTRVDREEQVNGEVLLPALDPPKLNPQKNKVTTTIECQSGCDVEALIGVFGGTAKHPKVTPLHKKKLHLKGGAPTTITMPLSAQDRAAAKGGLLVMTLQAKGGKEQVYPLTLGGLPDIATAGKSAVRPLAFPASAALKAGSVTVPVANPNGFKVKGSLELRLGKQRLGQAALAVPAHGERKLTVKLGRAAQAAVKRSGAKRLSAIASFRDPAGRAHRTSGTVALVPTSGGGTTPPGTPNGPAVPAETPIGPDGTYHGADGLTMLVVDGKVTAFNGQITTYCTVSEEQKSVAFGMFGDDPDPEVAADGSFAYEATTGYGFVKLKFEGRLDGDTATGKLVVEDRSPMSTSDGRLEFDYCFAGADWTATR